MPRSDLLRLSQTELRLCALRLQQQRGFELVFGVLRIFQAEINLAQQQPRRELSGSEFQAGFQRVARSGQVASLFPCLTFVECGSRVFGTDFSGLFQMLGGFRIVAGLKLQFSQLP